MTETTPAPRVPGKYGRKPRDPSVPVLTLEHYLRPAQGPVRFLGTWTPALGALPAATGDINYASLVTAAGGWPMYCNGPDAANPPGSPDGCGDCTCAAPAHMLQAWSAYSGHPEVTVPASSVLALYSAVSGYDPETGANDNGCQMTSVLAYLKATGIQDSAGNWRKVAGYAAFRDPSDLVLTAQILDTFGSVYLGYNMPQSAEAQFAAGQPFSVVPGSPYAGRHAVCLQRRRAGGTGILEVPCWGALQDVTRAFHRLNCEEAYAVVTADWLEVNRLTSVQGLDLEQLLNDMSDVT